MMLTILIFVLGAVIGSFLNVCIYRIPKEESIVSPPSACPHCRHRLSWRDNIPLVSFLLLRAKCRYCQGKISPRYFIVELLTALVFTALFLRFGVSLTFVMYALLASALIVSTFIDIELRLVYSIITYSGIAAGIICNALKGIIWQPRGYTPRFVIDSVIGAIVGGGIIYLTGKLFNVVYFGILKKPAIDGEKESMGFGDVELLAMIGAFLGWKLAVLTFFLAPFFGAMFGVFNLIVKKEHTMPYGPFLALGAFLSIFWGGAILALVIGR